MADKKISALTSATTPLAGTEVLPIVQGGATVKVSVNNLTIGKSVQTGALLSGTSSAVGQITSFAAATNDGAENAVSMMRFGTTYGSAIFHNYNSALNRETVNIAVSDGGSSPATNTLTKYRATADGSHYFYGATTSTLQASLSSGNLSLATGNLVIGTSGKGIDFSATAGTGTSELFADYEEGDWTPVPTNLTVVGTPTYTGKYTKIGRQVFIHLTVRATTSTASTANSTYFTGLPFTVAFGSTVSAVNNATVASLGVGLIDASNAIYTPTWSSGANQTITLSGFYYV